MLHGRSPRSRKSLIVAVDGRHVRSQRHPLCSNYFGFELTGNTLAANAADKTRHVSLDIVTDTAREEIAVVRLQEVVEVVWGMPHPMTPIPALNPDKTATQTDLAIKRLIVRKDRRAKECHAIRLGVGNVELRLPRIIAIALRRDDVAEDRVATRMLRVCKCTAQLASER